MSSRESMLINILSCFLLKGDSYKTLSSGAEYDNTLVCLTLRKGPSNILSQSGTI